MIARWERQALLGGVLALVLLFAGPVLLDAQEKPTAGNAISVSGSDPAKPSNADVRALRREIERMRRHEAAERKKVEALERRLDELESRKAAAAPAAPAGAAAGVSGAGAALTAAAPGAGGTQGPSLQSLQQQVSQLQTKVSGLASGGKSIGSMLSSYLGTHQFTFVGDAAFDFIYDKGQNTLGASNNTYAIHFAPIVLYNLNDWVLFEGAMSANDGGEGFGAIFYHMPVADAQIFLNPYLELVAGIFDQPFGEFYEDYSASWVNRFITAPLPYGANPLVPPTEIGLQLRGGYNWGGIGQNVDYTVWTGNGATFMSFPSVVPGDVMNGQTNIKVQSNGPSFGGRFRFYPLPVDSPLGYLELGASSYDSKWLDHLWMYTWGVDFAWHLGNLQARGEFLEMYQQMPAGIGRGFRQGWWVEAGYFLNGYRLPLASDEINRQFQKLELLARYTGINQGTINSAAVPAAGISALGFGFNGSPAIFTPYPREVALGVDYWIAPSIVWQTEVDFELPAAGGSFSNVGGVPLALAAVGAAPNDRAVLTQFAIGF